MSAMHSVSRPPAELMQPPLIEQAIVLPDMPDPQPGSDAYALASQRAQAAQPDLLAMPWLLPQGPDEWVNDIYDRLVEAERRFAAPNRRLSDYERGTATADDQLAVVGADREGGLLLTAEHATRATRLSGERYPDAGTAALAAVLAADVGTAVIMRGRQTGSVPLDPNHPLKDEVRRRLPDARGFFALHGMGANKFVRPTDTTEVQVCIGAGANPSEADTRFVTELTEVAHSLGLYAIGYQDYYVQKGNEEDGWRLRRNDDGSAYRHQLVAVRETSSVNFVRAHRERFMPAVQLELTRALRLTSLKEGQADTQDKKYMVVLGYLFVKAAAALALDWQQNRVGQVE